ncbi:MAG: outer-membrane lipoprotein carrier protein LolA [Deltaproteobacteria bacterium]|nr:outer-membrane lipoprotein carrier protein LolA [Deltaproteobacteria bacterium]
MSTRGAVAFLFALLSLCAACDEGSGAAPAVSTLPAPSGSASAAPSTAPSAPSARPDEATDAAPPEPTSSPSRLPVLHIPTAVPTARPKPSAERPAAPASSASAGPAATGAVPSAVPSAAPSATASASAPDAAATALPAPAAGSADEVAQRLDEIYAPIVRFRARFEQSYEAKVAGVTKKSSGFLLVERPSKLALSYQAPNGNRVVSDGATLKVYEQGNQQMLVQSVDKTEYPGAFAFIMGRGLRVSFSFSFHEKAKFPGGVVLVGKSRTPNPAYETVLFYVDQALLEKGDPAAIRRVLVLDAQGNRNRFDLTDVSQPDSLPAEAFRFEPPPGTTVLRP